MGREAGGGSNFVTVRQGRTRTTNSGQWDFELRENIKQDFSKRMKVLDKQMDVLKGKIGKAGDKAKAEWKEALKLMKVEKGAMKVRMDELKKASKKQLSKLKEKAKGVWGKIKAAYKKAVGDEKAPEKKEAAPKKRAAAPAAR